RLPLALATLIASTSAVAAERWRPGDAVYAAFGQGDYARALATRRGELDGCEAGKPAGDECIDLIFALVSIAQTAGDVKAGNDYGRRGVALAETVLPAGHPDIARAYNNLATSLINYSAYGEAERLVRKALALREAALPANH